MTSRRAARSLTRLGLIVGIYVGAVVSGCFRPTASPPARPTATAGPVRSSQLSLAARVERFEPAAEWDHFDDGGFAAYDYLTLEILSPTPFVGRRLQVRMPADTLPPQATTRQPATLVTLTIDAGAMQDDRLDWAEVAGLSLHR